MTNLKMSTIHNGHYHPLYHAGRAVRPDGYLSGQHPTLFRHLSEMGRGRIEERDRLHFCGLVHPPGETPTVFLPRAALQNDFSEDLATAQLTMRTLAKFGYRNRTRTDMSSFGPQGISQLGVVLDLAADYRDYGVYWLCCTNGLTVRVPLSPDRLIPRLL